MGDEARRLTRRGGQNSETRDGASSGVKQRLAKWRESLNKPSMDFREDGVIALADCLGGGCQGFCAWSTRSRLTGDRLGVETPT